jgi:hypothetical protein
MCNWTTCKQAINLYKCKHASCCIFLKQLFECILPLLPWSFWVWIALLVVGVWMVYKFSNTSLPYSWGYQDKNCCRPTFYFDFFRFLLLTFFRLKCSCNEKRTITWFHAAGAQCVLEVIPVNKGSLTKTVRTYTKSFKTSPLDGAGWYNW